VPVPQDDRLAGVDRRREARDVPPTQRTNRSRIRNVAIIEQHPNNWIMEGDRGGWALDAELDEMALNTGQQLSPEPSLNTSARWMMIAPKISPISAVCSPSPPSTIRNKRLDKLTTTNVFQNMPKTPVTTRRRPAEWESI
jgi:hypothetical protein